MNVQSDILEINGTKIGPGNPTYFIAEAGLNHNGDIKLAKKLIDGAKSSGASAVKFQTFQTEKFVRKSNKYFDLFKQAQLSYEDFGELSDYAKNQEMTFFSAPFDIESADLLKKIGVPAFKIASSDLINIPLIRHVAKMNLPIIISTGLSMMKEVEEAVDCCLYEGNSKIALLHCIAHYPTIPEEANLDAMVEMRQKFSHPIGYSDNGESTLVDSVAVSLGANLIEKHFTLDKKSPGPDHSFSIDPSGLKQLMSQIRLIEKIKGDGKKIPRESELEGRFFIRTSITADRNIKNGEILTKENLAIKRPAEGIEPKFFDSVIGRKVNKDINEDSAIHWADLE
jgi:N,N'-diacetyllegionaminate synthase